MTFAALNALHVKKARIEPLKGETADQYRERCRQKIGELGDFKLYDVGFREYMAYEKEYNEKLKESLSKGN